MATKHKLDSQDPHYQEGRRMALELKLDCVLAEARSYKKYSLQHTDSSCGEETRSVGDPPQTSKREFLGHGKPRGRQGGRCQASATVTQTPVECSLSSSVEVPLTVPSAELNPQEQFEKNMERLSVILASYPSAEPQRSSASSWSFQQQKSSECWKEARPYHLKCLIAKEAVGHLLCRECRPEEWFCGDCDVLHHKKQPLHNRECAIPPTSCVMKGKDGYCSHEQACLLPTVKVPDCSCEGTNFIVLPGKPVILITINGCFALHQPLYVCQTCQHHWTPDLKDLLRSGYWPASVTSSTLYTLDLLSSFQELKVISPGFSRQAFAKLLEHHTKVGGRSGHINACTPEMLAVSADGNRKLYRFRQDTSSDDPAFFEGLFVAEVVAVSRFVETIQKAVRNTQGKGTCGDSQWTAAREGGLQEDEEGMEVAVCLHGFLLKALNMYRGRYATKCEIKWSGRNQEGAGTAAGEEVEQVNSYLSRCALATKYMSKAARVDMLTLHAMGWNHKKSLSLYQSLSTRYVKTCQRLRDETARLAELKTELLCTDELVSQWLSDVKEWAAGKTPATSHASQGTTHRGLQQSIEGLYLSVRHRQNGVTIEYSRKLGEDKNLLLQEIEKYNGLIHSATNIDVAVVEHSLTGESTVSQIWPWEVHGSDRGCSIKVDKGKAWLRNIAGKSFSKVNWPISA
ncbi:hypothetical protein PHYPO_G00203020 [Pangasianodon hypophthalmus]|uniref:CxC3 like cysteine cluster domain-containing protein n=1 Tax=Pangasianodon hypophthalmus TaxID=310915 RepID=A0A5N5PBG9_PANHP|nr:hypothetical protein PHYPO_G00203020 [Pangasianodon hypophthalmus]